MAASSGSQEALPSWSNRWFTFVSHQHETLNTFLHVISSVSAKHPKRTLFAITTLSFFLITVGIFTNFRIEVNEEKLWTPPDSQSSQRSLWLNAIYPARPRYVYLFFHNHGKNIVSHDHVSRVFETLTAIQSTDGYKESCEIRYDGDKGLCEALGITQFWNNSAEVFANASATDDDIVRTISANSFPDRLPVALEYIMGYPERNESTHLIHSAQSFPVLISMPATDVTRSWETDAVKLVQSLNTNWDDLRVEVQAEGSLISEFLRSIAEDIPLAPLVFLMMASFIALVFARRHPVHSRSLLGISAVVAVLLSIISGYGILFIIGVPMTPVTQVMLFVVFAVGIDDAFVIIGSYNRTQGTPDERIAQTIDDIGLSITLTTLTSATAFALGCMSSVPAVYWLGLYSAPTIFVVFLYQLTFFVACIVLDERRIIHGKRDCLRCFSGANNPISSTSTLSIPPKINHTDKLMEYYARQLLKPRVKTLVVVAFTALFAVCGWRASLMTQKFGLADILPKDSYVTDFIEATRDYRETGQFTAQVHFRFVDQSDPEIQQEMRAFMDDLVAQGYALSRASYFWLDYFDLFQQVNDVSDLTFNEQMDLFLQNPIVSKLFRDEIVQDSNGDIVASRTRITVSFDADDVSDQISALNKQKRISADQSINTGKDEDSTPFFTYDGLYKMWEFFAIALDELTLTAIVGISAVSLTSFLFIPHWTASLFVTPCIIVLFVDLLGAMQLMGVHINPVSFVSVAMAIGILVDAVMHILFRYFESPGTREEKTVELLRTMGSSILLGGTTTFIGTLPLMFCSSEIFETVFYTFLGVVVLGMTHGLMLLPVLLATFGPEVVLTRKRRTASNQQEVSDTEGSLS